MEDQQPAAVALVFEVGKRIEEFDPDQKLREADTRTILLLITSKVTRTMDSMGRSEINDEDREFIAVHSRKMVQRTLERLQEEAATRAQMLRFQKHERVICNVGSDWWLSGSVQAVDPKDPKATDIAYAVKLDPPVNRLISLPFDSNDIVRAESCFGLRADGLKFTLFCLPHSTTGSKSRRFGVGERVACAVVLEDPRGTVWATGSITEVEVSMEEAAEQCLPQGAATSKWPLGVPPVPYRVVLDAGGSVLVHKDEHWLVRDLELHAGGSRQSRMEVRHHNGCWEKVDHMTRRVRPCEPPDS